MATHFNILAWEIPWTKEPEGLQSIALQKSQTWLVCVCISPSVISDSLRPHGLLPARHFCLWSSSGKNTGVSGHSFLQGIFPIQGSNSGLMHCRLMLYSLSHQEAHLVTKQQQLWCITDVFNSKWQHAKEEKKCSLVLTMTYLKLTSSLLC